MENENIQDNTNPEDFDSLHEAQLRLVHAMLISRYHDTPESVSRRVDNVYLSIKHSSGIWHHTWLKVATSMAAGLLIIIGLSFLFSNPDNVYADFDNIMKRFSTCDQTYEITIHKIQNIDSNENNKPTRLDIRNIKTMREINGATLYVRGNQYVLERTLKDGTLIYNGFDGTNKWRSDKAEPRKFSKPGSIHRVVPEGVTDLLFVDIGELLNVMCNKYKVTRGRDNIGNMTGLYYVAFKKNIPALRLPERIDLWVDPDNGQIKKLFCINVSFETKKYNMVITLKNTDQLPPDWFCHRLPDTKSEGELDIN